MLHAIRDDEVAVRASGINTPRYKLDRVRASPARAAGFAGALFAHYLRVAGPSTLEVALSFQVVIWGIFGGVATIYGPVAAVFILYPLTEWLGSFRAFGELRLLIFAVDRAARAAVHAARAHALGARQDRDAVPALQAAERRAGSSPSCRRCAARALQAQVAGAQRLVGHE